MLTARKLAYRAWLQAEEEPFLETMQQLSPCELPIPPMGRQEKAALHEAVMADAVQIHREMEWDRDALEMRLPQLAAATRVASRCMWQLARSYRVEGAASAKACCSLWQAPYAGPTGLQQQRRRAEHGEAPLRVGLISFGYSGGADRSASVILLDRWMDVASLMGSLDVAAFWGTGCRLLPGVSLKEALPSFPFDAAGPRSARFDAVVGFLELDSAHSMVWREDWSSRSRITWWELDSWLLCMAIYIPPLSNDHPEHERRQLMAEAFRQYDAAMEARARDKRSWDAVI